MTAPPGAAWKVAYEAKALTFAGLAPALVACRVCGLPAEPPMRYDPVAGGAAHSHCEGSGGSEVSVAWLEAVEQGRTRFVPANWANTYFEWMRNIQPWCISRQLWWGHQIPVWYGFDLAAQGFKDDEGDGASGDGWNR